MIDLKESTSETSQATASNQTIRFLMETIFTGYIAPMSSLYLMNIKLTR